MQSLARLVAAAALALTLALALARLWRGPHAVDRVVAMDLVSYAAIGLVALAFVETRQAGLIEVALLVGATSFLGTVALARAIETHGRAARDG